MHSVNIQVDGGFLTRFYRDKVSKLGLTKALEITMEQTGLSKENALELLKGDKKIYNDGASLSLCDESK